MNKKNEPDVHEEPSMSDFEKEMHDHVHSMFKMFNELGVSGFGDVTRSMLSDPMGFFRDLSDFEKRGVRADNEKVKDESNPFRHSIEREVNQDSVTHRFRLSRRGCRETDKVQLRSEEKNKDSMQAAPSQSHFLSPVRALTSLDGHERYVRDAVSQSTQTTRTQNPDGSIHIVTRTTQQFKDGRTSTCQHEQTVDPKASWVDQWKAAAAAKSETTQRLEEVLDDHKQRTPSTKHNWSSLLWSSKD